MPIFFTLSFSLHIYFKLSVEMSLVTKEESYGVFQLDPFFFLGHLPTKRNVFRIDMKQNREIRDINES